MSDLSRPLTDDPKRLLPAHLERLPMPSQERKCYNLPFCLLLAAYWVGTCAQLACTPHIHDLTQLCHMAHGHSL